MSQKLDVPKAECPIKLDVRKAGCPVAECPKAECPRAECLSVPELGGEGGGFANSGNARKFATFFSGCLP